jgi:hypothetical protein
MSEKKTLFFVCICEKGHPFEERFNVAGPGSSVVQVRCPHPQCPTKDQWLSYEIPWALAKNETELKGGDPPHTPTQS